MNQLIDQIFEQHKNMIYSRAASFHKSTGIDQQDLLAQGYLIFCQAHKAYLSEKQTKFSTFLFTCLNNGLRNYIKNQYKHSITEKISIVKLSDLIQQADNNTVKYCAFVNTLILLSKEAKYIIEVLLNSPKEILDVLAMEKPWIVRRKLYKHLRKEGWQKPKIEKRFNEIKQLLYNN